ncbi:SRPBCC family protein [Hyphomicrobium sp.]|uniref:SRPBCC family protein n=1 Tax=Hyphomicrobium sp. TaxID=82 RepID=UPI002E31DB35|nr:SRPBCC family protein [Hyphomicrobium sp.]HEX2843110.1 SRPBCC family protein [Hyphomicrobium sp.]
MPGGKRTDTASRIIAASPPVVYRALIDPAAIVEWRPPKGMTGQFFTFEPREGGRFRMALTYTDGGGYGKTAEHTDIVEGHFVELVPDERVVEAVEFESDDPAFAGTMRITTILLPCSGGTKVTIRCEDVPPGISAEDHQAGLTSTLANLAAFTE